MKAAVVHEFGAPLAVEEVAAPEPSRHEVLVRIETSGLCHTDIHTANGDWEAEPTLPLIPGHEGVGIVEAAGAEAAVEVGTRVAIPWLGRACGECELCAAGRENLCARQRNTGYSHDGCFAELIATDARYVVPVPDGVDPVDAAPLTCAGLTTYAALRRAGTSTGRSRRGVRRRRPRAPGGPVRACRGGRGGRRRRRPREARACAGARRRARVRGRRGRTRDPEARRGRPRSRRRRDARRRAGRVRLAEARRHDGARRDAAARRLRAADRAGGAEGDHRRRLDRRHARATGGGARRSTPRARRGSSPRRARSKRSTRRWPTSRRAAFPAAWCSTCASARSPPRAPASRARARGAA